MAYGYNDGDQRRQSVRLAGRTTPTPRSATSSNPQRPQEQPRPSSRQQASRTRQSGRPSTGTSAQQDSRLGARTRQRQAEVPQLRRNGARQPGIHINRFFSHPQGGRDRKPYRSTSHVNAPALPARRLRLALCSILTCLVFVLMSSCMSHGSAGLEPPPRTSCSRPPSRPVILSPFRPRARNGKPARCPISIRSTLRGLSCLTPAAPSAKMPAGLRASPWSISLRRDAPI